MGHDGKSFASYAGSGQGDRNNGILACKTTSGMLAIHAGYIVDYRMIRDAVAAVSRLYPLKSGCGSFANSAFFRWIDPQGGDDGIIPVMGGRAAIPAGDYVGRSMRFAGDLDPKVSWALEKAILPGDTALDIGGNLGLVTLLMARAVGPSGKVHTFEPQPRMQNYLRQTKALNPKLTIELHEIALGAQDETLFLVIPPENAGSAKLAHDCLSNDNRIAVQVEKLTDYAKRNGIQKADVVKIDVEGFEAQVLSGAQEFFMAYPPRVIVLEQHKPYSNQGLSEALSLLRIMGYDLYGLPRALFRPALVPIDRKPVSHDFVAVHSTCPTSVRNCLGL
jgi:FkbM family methyltransferase